MFQQLHKPVSVALTIPPPPCAFAFPQFNKSVSVEAGLSFPENVTCNTINSASLKGNLCNYGRGPNGHLTCTTKELQSAITAKGYEDVRPLVDFCPWKQMGHALFTSASFFSPPTFTQSREKRPALVPSSVVCLELCSDNIQRLRVGRCPYC